MGLLGHRGRLGSRSPLRGLMSGALELASLWRSGDWAGRKRRKAKERSDSGMGEGGKTGKEFRKAKNGLCVGAKKPPFDRWLGVLLVVN